MTYTFFVKGMHCTACESLTEIELSEHPGVTSVKSSLATCSVEICGDFGCRPAQEVIHELSPLLSQHSLLLEQENKMVVWKDFWYAIPFALAFIGLFILLQKLGIVNLVTSAEVGYGTAFVIGLIASVSTCMAVVGGLVLSMSANFAKEGKSLRPQLLFHVSRLVSFFVLGGAIGALGSSFQLGATGTFVLSFVVAIVLLILGINLLDIFPGAKKFQPSLPKFMGARVQRLKNLNSSVTPALVGLATFFLPCGFTQSMQIYTLTTGNAVTGAFIMFAFALGTLPVLALLSFSSVRLPQKKSGIFFKTAGIVVIFFGLFNIINSLVGAGVIRPLYTL